MNFGRVEAQVNVYLNQYPELKKLVKRCYQKCIYVFSKKEKSSGKIIRLSPDNKKEYFFGYYDKTPWDRIGKHVLCMCADDTSKKAESDKPAEILLIDSTCQTAKTIAETSAWNVQQGCMLQWLGPTFEEEIIFNDFRNGQFCGVILNVKNGNERIISRPVYAVSLDGTTALTLDFSRLHRLRYGYGYPNLEDSTKNEKLPDKTCIWKINLLTGEVEALLNYTDFANFEPKESMKGAEHKINHIMISPNGRRFMVLHRWFQKGKKYTRLVTCRIDGKDLYNLSDDDMVSHCCWKNNDEILAFANKKKSGAGYYLMKDHTQEYKHLWKNLYSDGHPSYSPDEKMAITDTYPNRKRMSSLILLNKNNTKIIAKVFSPFKYDNDTRCDLHPRWDRLGKKVCFDATFEGHRGLYYVEVE